jgi:hypothetical protein
MITFSNRLDAALARRLRPHTPLMVKQLCSIIGISDDTLRNMRNGVLPPSLTALTRLFAHFGADFRREVMGDNIDRLFWFSAAGSVVPTADLMVSAREYQELPDTVPGDHAAALRRNEGWVSLAVAHNGIATVRYHEHGLAIKAVKRLSAYLLDHAGQDIAVVRRIVELQEHDGTTRVVDVANEMPRIAASALERAAAIARLPSPPPWRIDRINLAETRHPRANELLRAFGEAEVLDAVGRANLLPYISLVQERDGALYTFRVGSHIRLPDPVKDSMLGPSSGVPDIRYREVADHCVRETLAEGQPTCRRISGVICGRPVKWIQTAMPASFRTYISHVQAIG